MSRSTSTRSRHNVRTLSRGRVPVHGGREGRRLRSRGDGGRAKACVDAGAAWLGVALVEEGLRLCERRASTRRSWCCRSSRPGRSRAARRAGLTPVAGDGPGLGAARRGGRELGVADRRAREGGHRHAPPRGVAPGRPPAFVDAGRLGRASGWGGLWTHFAEIRGRRGDDERVSSIGSSAVVDAVRAAGHQPATPARCEHRRVDPVSRGPGSIWSGSGIGIYGVEPGARGGRGIAGPATRAHLALERHDGEAPPGGGADQLRPPLRARAGRVGRDRAGRLRRRLPSGAVLHGRRPDRAAGAAGWLGA